MIASIACEFYLLKAYDYGNNMQQKVLQVQHTSLQLEVQADSIVKRQPGPDILPSD